MDTWTKHAQLARAAAKHDNAVMRAAAALLQAHLLVDALAENLLQAIAAENLLGDMVDTPDGVVRYANEAEYDRRGYDRLYMAALNDEDGATMQEHLAAALEANC